jgi:hypothetical protein
MICVSCIKHLEGTDSMKVASNVDMDGLQIVVNDREQLIYLLTEAAEIEHGLMCSYLYANWSLKERKEEGLTDTQLCAIDCWRNSMQSVAMEEMLHLALVNNLLMSLGSPPHFMRPNFPIAPGYHPSSVIVRLTPFTRETAEHFVYLERPEGVEQTQASGFEAPVAYERYRGPSRLTPTAEDYGTISHLYRGIENGFRHLTNQMGEKTLFIGDPRVQVTSDILRFEGLIPVTNLESALSAVTTIIEQGEGSQSADDDSHHNRFCVIRDEYDAFLAEDANFCPHRPVVSDPVMFRSVVKQETVHVSEPLAARVLDATNASYGLMLRLLASGFSMSSGKIETRRIEIESAISVMSVMKSLAKLLTTLTANANHGDETAGMNFHLARATLALPQRDAGSSFLAERANEIGNALAALAKDTQLIESFLSQKLHSIADALCAIQQNPRL